MNNGYRTYQNGTSWLYFETIANEYDLEFLQTSSSKEVLNWMNTKDDPLIICSMGPGLWTSNGHFIVLWKIENNMVYINDPASVAEERNKNSYNKLVSQCKQYFCFNKTKKKKIEEIQLKFKEIKFKFILNIAE